MINVYEAVDSNKRKSAFIIVGFVVFVAVAVYVISQALSYYLGYQPGGLGAVGLALIISVYRRRNTIEADEIDLLKW